MKTLDNPTLWRALLVTVLVPLMLIAFWPTPVDHPVHGQLVSTLRLMHNMGVPLWVDYQFVEASANVALFVPLGVFASLAYTNLPWWKVGISGLCVSGSIELCQLLFLPHRFATLQDVATNTGGAVLGALVATALKSRHARRLSPPRQ